MIAEKNNARGIVDLRILANVVLKENRCHRSNVLVAETQVSLSKSGITWLYAGNANAAAFVHHVPREDFLRYRHRPLVSSHRWQEHLLLHPRHIEGKQPAVLNHLPRDLIFAGGKLGKCNLFPAADPIDQREVGRSQHSQVLAVLTS